MKQQLVFLLGLPRSGTTLLTRTLAASDEVLIGPEYWFLLPLVDFLSGNRNGAIYSQALVRKAGAQMSEALGTTTAELERDAARAASATLYNRIAEQLSEDKPDARYLVDKTPRYCSIAPKLLSTFDDAKFIVLARNPLDILASIVSTWNDGRWRLDRYLVDLVDGVQGLAEVVRTATDDQLLHLHYETLVQDPESALRSVDAFLDLGTPLGTTAVAADRAFKQWNSWLGDPKATGTEDDKIQARESRRSHLAGSYRGRWIERYIDTVGLDDFETLGYGRDDLTVDERLSASADAARSARDVADSGTQSARGLIAPKGNRTREQFERRPLY